MMKAAARIFLAIYLWSVASATAADVPVVYAKYANATYSGNRPSLDLFGDALFIGCNPPFGKASAIYVPRSDGTYQTINNVVENMPNGTEYCRGPISSEFFYFNSGTTGKIFFNSRVDGNAVNSLTVFFTLDENYQPTNIKELPIGFNKFQALPTGAIYGISLALTGGSAQVVVDFTNGEWTYEFVNKTLPKNVSTTGTCSFGAYQVNSRTVDNNLQPQVYCMQSDLTWAFIQQPVYTDLDQYDNTTLDFYFNGEDIISFTGRSKGLATGGTLYMGRLDGTVVTSFNMIDYGENFDYVREDTYLWADDILWINKDLAVMITLELPKIFDDVGGQSGGSIGIVVRDENDNWKLGGKIKLDDTLPNMYLNQMGVTKSSIMAFGNSLIPGNRTIYTYPVCFKDQLNVTCKQNVQLNSCDQNNPPALTDAYSYEDDGCGKPDVSTQSINFANEDSSAVMRFERLGVKVGQCTVTFTCPRPKTSVGDQGAVQFGGIVGLLALIFL